MGTLKQEEEKKGLGVEELLGAGAKMLERLVLKDLYSNLSLVYEEKEGYAFADYLKGLSFRET